MGSFRFYRRVRIFPGLSVNISKSGPSLTLGMRGAHMTFGRNGVTKTVGIPGTGIYYTSREGCHSGFHSAHHETPLSEEEQAAADRKAERTVLVLALVVVMLAIALVGSLSR